MKKLDSKDLSVASWFGTLPSEKLALLSKDDFQRIIELSREIGVENINGKAAIGNNYEKIGLFNEEVYPWYQYWEVMWVINNGPVLKPGMKVLDAGGASSLLSCWLASQGVEVYSIDLSEKLVKNGDRIAQKMSWSLRSSVMNMCKLDFPNGFFDHAYSICVFEHLTFEEKQMAMSEITRCLKQDGYLCVTFDYANPAPYIMNKGMDSSIESRLSTPEDVSHAFVSSGKVRVIGNVDFYDNGERYIINPKYDRKYTFGSLFMQKICN